MRVRLMVMVIVMLRGELSCEVGEVIARSID